MAEPIKGEKFVANVVASDRVTIVADKVRAYFVNDPKTLETLVNTTKVYQLKCSRLAGEKKQFKMPDLSNATPGGLVDMLGELREEIADLKKLEGIYKSALEARSGTKMTSGGDEESGG